MAKNREQLIESMIRNIQELYSVMYVGKNGCDRSDYYILHAYKLSCKILQEQRKNIYAHKKQQIKDIADSGEFDKIRKNAIDSGLVVVDNAMAFGLSHSIAAKILEPIKWISYKYYKYYEEFDIYNDCVEFFNSSLYDEFVETFERIFFDDCGAFSVRGTSRIFTAFDACKEWEDLLNLNGHAYLALNKRRYL